MCCVLKPTAALPTPTNSTCVLVAPVSGNPRLDAGPAGVPGSARGPSKSFTQRVTSAAFVRKLALFATLLVHFADILTDGATAYVYWHTGHVWWFDLCLLFMAIGPVCLGCYRLWLAASRSCASAARRGDHRWWAWAIAVGSFLHVDSVVSVVGVVQASRRKRWLNDPFDQPPPLAAKADGMALSIQDFRFLEGISEALPQVCLQGYVLLVLRLTSLSLESSGWGTAVQTASFLLSLLSISITVAYVRITWQAKVGQNLLSQLNIVCWTLAETALKVLGLAFFGAAFRSYLFVAIGVVLVAKAVLVAVALTGKGLADKAVYLALSMVVWFEVEDEQGRSWPRRAMFAVDTVVAALFLALPLVSELAPPADDPVLGGAEVVTGLCNQFTSDADCDGFPWTYIASYIVVMVVTQLGFWVHELRLVDTGSTALLRVLRCCPCCACFTWCSCCRGLPCGRPANRVVALHTAGSDTSVLSKSGVWATGSNHSGGLGSGSVGDSKEMPLGEDLRRGSDSSFGSAASGHSRDGRHRQTYGPDQHKQHRRAHKHLRKHIRNVQLTETDDEGSDSDQENRRSRRSSRRHRHSGRGEGVSGMGSSQLRVSSDIPPRLDSASDTDATTQEAHHGSHVADPSSDMRGGSHGSHRVLRGQGESSRRRSSSRLNRSSRSTSEGRVAMEDAMQDAPVARQAGATRGRGVSGRPPRHARSDTGVFPVQPKPKGTSRRHKVPVPASVPYPQGPVPESLEELPVAPPPPVMGAVNVAPLAPPVLTAQLSAETRGEMDDLSSIGSGSACASSSSGSGVYSVDIAPTAPSTPGAGGGITPFSPLNSTDGSLARRMLASGGPAGV